MRRRRRRGRLRTVVMLVVLRDVALQPLLQCLQQAVDAVDPGLELEPELDAAARLLPLEIDTLSVVARAPRARRLRPVALYLACLAQLASAATTGRNVSGLLRPGRLIIQRRSRLGRTGTGAEGGDEEGCGPPMWQDLS